MEGQVRLREVRAGARAAEAPYYPLDHEVVLQGDFCEDFSPASNDAVTKEDPRPSRLREGVSGFAQSRSDLRLRG